MKYVVEITEYLVKRVIVEADTKREANEIVRKLYADDGEITLDYEDFYDSRIDCLREATEKDIENYPEYMEI